MMKIPINSNDYTAGIFPVLLDLEIQGDLDGVYNVININTSGPFVCLKCWKLFN